MGIRSYKKGADTHAKNNRELSGSIFESGPQRPHASDLLMNGFQMRGIITGFDQFVILLQSDGRQQMIYKHAVSTMTPAAPVHLTQG